MTFQKLKWQWCFLVGLVGYTVYVIISQPLDGGRGILHQHSATMLPDARNNSGTVSKDPSVSTIGQHSDKNSDKNNNNNPVKTQPPQKQDNRKIILFWEPFFGSWYYGFGLGHGPFIKHKCPVTDCVTSSNKSLVNEATAVVFHMANHGSPPTFPKVRFPNQSYVFSLLENPLYRHRDCYNGVFNFTMTYKQDSDIPIPYGEFKSTGGGDRAGGKTEKQIRGLVAKKTKLVAWFVSNCNTHSKREHYVSALKKHIPVDIYGDCGNQTYTKVQSSKDYTMLETDYKFYLSFENTFCEDYVTEKLFKILGKYVIPIVRGGANYTLITPPHSVIDVQDFPTPKHLAEFLLELAKNDTRYIEYFKWKKQYSVIGQYELRQQGICKLCERLHNSDLPNQVHNNLSRWWGIENNCEPYNADIWICLFVVLLIALCVCFIHFVCCRGSRNLIQLSVFVFTISCLCICVMFGVCNSFLERFIPWCNQAV